MTGDEQRQQDEQDVAEDLELNDESADKIRGGSENVAVNKAKTADKAYTQMDGYIKG
jgi:hypothetical protein